MRIETNNAANMIWVGNDCEAENRASDTIFMTLDGESPTNDQATFRVHPYYWYDVAVVAHRFRVETWTNERLIVVNWFWEHTLRLVASLPASANVSHG